MHSLSSVFELACPNLGQYSMTIAYMMPLEGKPEKSSLITFDKPFDPVSFGVNQY